VDQNNLFSGINSTTDVVVQLHFHFTSGSKLIGHGNLSLESRSKSGTTGILKNTAKF